MPQDSRIYIFVPFKDRDEARGLGARGVKTKSSGLCLVD